jgi:hypothetical protein
LTIKNAQQGQTKGGDHVANSTVANIRELVQQGEPVAAAEGVEAWLKGSPGDWKQEWTRDWSAELILHVSSVRRLRESTRKGLVTREQETVELRQIS